MLQRLLFAATALALTGCATTPLFTGFPAHSAGEGNADAALAFQMHGGKGTGSPYVGGAAGRVRYGVSDRFDLIAATDLSTLTAIGKWTWIESIGSWNCAVAPLGGVAFAWDDHGVTAGVSGSCRFEALTPYAVVRWNRTGMDATQVDTTFFRSPPKEHFAFWSWTLGMQWDIPSELSKGALVGLEVVFLANSKEVHFAGSPLVSLQLGFHL